MTIPSNAMSESPLQSQGIAPAAIPATRLMYWSVRRELWENQSIYIAPLAAAIVFLFGFLINTMIQRHHMRDVVWTHEMFATPYEVAAALIMGSAFLVGIFYSLDTLYGERRDRSILFWKSLPVSDLTTVLAKASIPLVVLPLLSFAITIAAQLLMLLLSNLVLLGSGVSMAMLWANAPLFHFSLALLYHILTVHGLWYAPIYGWLLFISAWAPRAPFLWAFLPPFVIGGVEKLAFHSEHFFAILLERLAGSQMSTTTDGNTLMDVLPVPMHFFIEPGLWIGLAIAAGFLVAAVRLRRHRGPV